MHPYILPTIFRAIDTCTVVGLLTAQAMYYINCHQISHSPLPIAAATFHLGALIPAELNRFLGCDPGIRALTSHPLLTSASWSYMVLRAHRDRQTAA